MTAYRVFVFLHLLGVFGMFGGLGIEAAALVQFARARASAPARQALDLLRINRVIGPASLLLLLLPGLYMAYTTWTFEPIWIRLPFWILVMVMLIGGLVSGRQTVLLTRELEASQTQDSQPDGRRRQSLLASSWFVRTALLLGASFLMVTKPTPGVCALVLGCALAAGLLASLTQLRTAPSQTASAARE